MCHNLLNHGNIIDILLLYEYILYCIASEPGCLYDPHYYIKNRNY